MQKSPDERKHTSKTRKFHKITLKIRLVGIWKKKITSSVNGGTSINQQNYSTFALDSWMMHMKNENAEREYNRFGKFLTNREERAQYQKTTTNGISHTLHKLPGIFLWILMHSSEIIFLHSSYAVKPHGLSICCCLS